MPRNRMFVREVKSVGFVDLGACGGVPNNGGADIVVFKRSLKPMSDKAKDAANVEKNDDAQPTTTPELDAANARIAALEAENATLRASATEPAEKAQTEEDVLKNADPAVIAIIEKQRKATEDAQKRADEAAEIAKSERDKRETREWVEKAGAYKALPASPEKLGPVLRKAAAALDDDEFKTLSEVLKAGDGALNEALKERGRSGASDESSAVAEVNKRAEALLAEGKFPTIEQARKAVRQADRELADRERQERRG